MTQQGLEPLLHQLGWQAPRTVGSSKQSQERFARPPSTAREYFETGKRLARQGDLNAALVSFNDAIRLNPNYIAAYNQLGNVQQRLGQLDTAIATYQHLLTLNPNVAQAHCNLGAIWQSQGKPDEAMVAYRKAIDLKPDLAVAHQNLANLLASLGANQQHGCSDARDGCLDTLYDRV